MKRSQSYSSFAEFRQEILRHRSGPLSSPVDEIVDEMYHTEIQDDFESMWDAAGDED